MRSLIATAICVSLASFASADDLAATHREPTHIPAQSLGTALQSFAKARELYLVYAAQDVTEVRTQGAIGELTDEEALQRLLEGTGLTYRYVDAKTVSIVPVDTKPSGADVKPQMALEEIVVTANRREQDVQEVPASVQVLSGRVLDQLGANDFEDYLNAISGVGMTRSGSGTVKAGVRGVSNVIGSDSGVGDSTSAVGLYLNDVPIQGSGPLPDMALYDVQRIEVLKGPQGTLYGEGAMGGAIKMILTPPEPGVFSTRAEGGVSVTEDGGTNYEVKGVVNLPLIDERMAARLVASYRDDGGFVDNTFTNRDDVDSSTTLNFRGLLTWSLTDALSAEVLALHQDFDQDDFGEVVAGLGDLQSNLPEDRYHNVDFDLYALTLKYDLGGAELVSSSSYWQNERQQFYRAGTVGYFLNFTLEPFGLPLVAPADPQGFTLFLDQQAFTQELRLSSTGDERIDWAVGAFYRSARQNSTGYDTVVNFQAINDAMQSAGTFPPSALFESSYEFESKINEQFKQTALFGEVDIGLTDRLDLKLGARWFEEDLDLYQRSEGLNLVALDLEGLGIPNPDISNASAKDDNVIGRAGLSYRLSDDKMLYTLVSQGFRSGGPNFNAGLSGTTVPDLFKSDSLINYEIGAKTTWLDGRLIANASVYFIDWSDVQVRVSGATTAYIDNAGKAEVRGGELQLIAAPADRWQLGLNLGLLQSELTSLAPGASGRIGSELPNAPETTGSAYVQYKWPLAVWGDAHVRADYLYVGEQTMELLPVSGPTDDYYLDAYDIGRVQAGVENDRWGAFVFADNIWNERAVTSKSRLNPPLNFEERLSLIRPRTYGVRFRVSF